MMAPTGFSTLEKKLFLAVILYRPFSIFSQYSIALFKIKTDILLDTDSGHSSFIDLLDLTYSLSTWSTVQKSRVWLLTGLNMILSKEPSQ